MSHLAIAVVVAGACLVEAGVGYLLGGRFLRRRLLGVRPQPTPQLLVFDREGRQVGRGDVSWTTSLTGPKRWKGLWWGDTIVEATTGRVVFVAMTEQELIDLPMEELPQRLRRPFRRIDTLTPDHEPPRPPRRRRRWDRSGVIRPDRTPVGPPVRSRAVPLDTPVEADPVENVEVPFHEDPHRSIFPMPKMDPKLEHGIDDLGRAPAEEESLADTTSELHEEGLALEDDDMYLGERIYEWWGAWRARRRRRREDGELRAALRHGDRGVMVMDDVEVDPAEVKLGDLPARFRAIDRDPGQDQKGRYGGARCEEKRPR